MAVTCSESGFNAISDAMKLPNSSVIHTIDGIWAMQEFPVEVTHARQRVLTLLELFILKALNQIPNCSVRDIITGLRWRQQNLMKTLKKKNQQFR